jgi:hypothetical protein
MRAASAWIVAWGFAVAAGPAWAQNCDPNPVVTVTFDENDDHPDGPRCDVTSVAPNPVVVCDDNSTIAWVFKNDCDRDLKPKIGRRKSVYPKRRRNEPLTTTADLKPAPETVPANTTAPLAPAPVDTAAKNGRYKYDIAGSIDVDPEIDVRRPTKIY